MIKIILHCHNPDNLIFMTRTAEHCIDANMVEKDWKVFTYGEGQLNPPIIISAIKRKSCITIYDQPEATHDRPHD